MNKNKILINIEDGDQLHLEDSSIKSQEELDQFLKDNPGIVVIDLDEKEKQTS